MLTKNMGSTDRVIRAILGLVLLAVFFSITGGWKWLALVVGLLLLLTAMLGSCPPYKLLGISTRRQ